MALGMYLRDSVAVILSNDDAVKDPVAYAAYVEAGYDESKLKLEGEPTRFTLRRMSYDQVHRADDMGGAAQSEFIVRCSLTQIANYRVHSAPGADGELRLAPEDFEHSREFDRPLLKQDWLRKSNLPPSLLGLLATISRIKLSEASIPFARG
jgi:hypothetical protein